MRHLGAVCGELPYFDNIFLVQLLAVCITDGLLVETNKKDGNVSQKLQFVHVTEKSVHLHVSSNL